MREPFCTKPWTELSYNTNGVRPCCVWNGEKYQGNLSEYKSSKYIKRIKKSMIDHNMDFLNKSCFDCIDNEKQNLYSPRQSRQAKHLELFEYWPSNICNLKCIMCSANNSNLIEEEEINLGLRQPVEKHITDISKFDFENVKILRVYGGEPTAGVHTFQQLKSVADRGYAKNITLAYTTNATSYNKIWTNIANQFAETDVGISVDGTGKVFEYIRQNAKWNKVEENIFKIINDATNYEFSIVLQTTSFILVDKWIDFFLQFPANNIGMYQLYDVPGRLTAIPDNIKQRLVNKLENKNHVLANKIINILQNAEFDIEELQAYKDYVLMLDRRRGTNILELDPIFEELLK